MSRATEQFGDLLAIMRRLRSPEGCPWDREQTLESLRRYLIEETYEVIDAIDRRDWKGLAEELGDLQLQVVFQAEIARSEGWFDIQAVLETINSKLVRRHPHVFESESLKTADDVTQRWEQIKREEKPQPQGEGLLDKVPRHQPAMLEAHQAGKLAAESGFDWQKFEDMGDKLAEEFREVCEALQASDPERVEDEIGDLIFMAVNVARFSGVDPELALKRANSKFRQRFRSMERALAAEGREMAACTPAELEQLWQRAKQD